MAYSQPLSAKAVKKPGISGRDISTQPGEHDVEYKGN
jgi:hypothetical protein